MAFMQAIKDWLSDEQNAGLHLRPLKEKDIPHVLAIERDVYPYPWSGEIFKDCLKAGYSNWALVNDDVFMGYAIMSIAVGEAHILNICIAPDQQGKGYGQSFLNELCRVAKDKSASSLFLEVRPSNTSAIALYKKTGFRQIGTRKNYYPNGDQREDAIVLSLELSAI